MTRPQDMDLSMAVVNGNTEGLVAMVEAVRRYGARDLELGYDWPDDQPDPGPDDTVTWYAVGVVPQPARWVAEGPTRGGGHARQPSARPAAGAGRADPQPCCPRTRPWPTPCACCAAPSWRPGEP